MQKTVSFIENENLAITNKLIGSPYPFACWKLPDTEEKYLIISLSPLISSNSLKKNLSGFLINTFENNKPMTPSLIRKDLLFDGQNWHLSDVLSPDSLTAFYRFLEEVDFYQSKNIPHPKIDLPDFEDLTKKAINEIKLGNFRKVVLSRFKDVLLPNDFNPLNFFEIICKNYPSAFCSFFYLPGEGVWIGASPEILCTRNKRSNLKTVALAGTKKALDSWEDKELIEQEYVYKYICKALENLNIDNYQKTSVDTINIGSLYHLKTTFYIENTDENIFSELTEKLHPTPAVCGMPFDKSLDFILKNEGYERSYYSGVIGPHHIQQSSHLFVNLRCAKICGNTMRLFAGAGITKDSIPKKEALETEWKMNLLLKFI